ncbi:MAG: hydantoinase/oxoprolinase family protein [Kosmotoga sp.]|nr:MAG: hydantoinase/oxoprolinase family protein [Kosmotoga sp.]
MIISVDTGGTFTDFVYLESGKMKALKVPSTPEDPSNAVLAGINNITKESSYIFHGSTVAVNALLEGKGSKTALITNSGFEDLIEIGRQTRDRLYDLYYRRPKIPIPSELRFGITGRIDSRGNEIEPIDVNEISDTIDKIEKLGINSAAVILLFSFLNSTHERFIGKLLEEKGINTSLSCDVLPEFREYERTSTTFVNAYVSPVMKQYISKIKEFYLVKNLSIMQSNGGRLKAESASEFPVRTILSGPAGGVVGAFELSRAAGYEKIITFDMGGTSTDVALLNGEIPFRTETKISSFVVKTPVIDIHTLGAGGGSIAKIDKGGALKVGPESAGADPGPVCYGKGSDLTVTDANLFLGRLPSDNLLDGKFQLHRERVKKPMIELAEEAGLKPFDIAEGICEVANVSMERAIRKISVERGYDPSEFALVTFGGAGAMHSVFLAKQLNIPKIIIPDNPGVLSAFGMLVSDNIRDYSLTVMLQNDTSFEDIKKLFLSLEKEAEEDFSSDLSSKSKTVIERFLDVRYKGQSYELVVPFTEDFRSRFHKEHNKMYGYCNEDKSIEIVNIRVRAKSITEKPEIVPYKIKETSISENAYLGTTKTIFGGEPYSTKLFSRKYLRYGNRVAGPAIVLEYSSTTVIPPFAKMEVDQYGNMVITLRNDDL